jgi:dephospho-CoA kinase
MKIAVTGNIGSGKSTFVSLLQKYLKGYEFYDVDALVHQLYNNHVEFNVELEEMFGTNDRKELSDIVFDQPAKRKALEDVTKEYMTKVMDEIKQKFNIVVEFPLLFEMRCASDYDLIICCYVEDDIQRYRVLDRDGITVEKFEKIRAAQLSTNVKKAMSHMAIDTCCSFDELESYAKNIAYMAFEEGFEDRFVQLFDPEDYITARVMFQDIIKHYGESHRGPHSLNHLKAIFRLFDEVRDKLYYPEIVQLAIWFHDIIYDIPADKYPLNEIKSAQYMFDTLIDNFEGIEKSEIDGLPLLMLVGEFILTTNGHKITSPYILGNEKLKHDCEVFLDMDLGVFSADKETVEKYDDGIRNEFQIYDDETYYPARVEVLASFLKRDRIYYSEEFKDKEEIARQNLQFLIGKNKGF